MSGTGDPATPPAKAPSVVPSVATIVVALGVAVALALAGSSGGATTGGVGVFALCVAVAFAINWVVWVPSTLARILELPDDLFSLAFGTEWFIEHGRPASDPADDVFASLGDGV